MRNTILLAVFTSTFLASMVEQQNPYGKSAGSAANPCQMSEDFNASARSFLRAFLTDTGENGPIFARTRSQLGIEGISFDQVVVVQDTIKCRGAINSWKSYFATLGPEIGAEASQFNNGMLFRLTPNRYILATPMLNKYSFLTYIALDSSWTVVRKNL